MNLVAVWCLEIDGIYIGVASELLAIWSMPILHALRTCPVCPSVDKRLRLLSQKMRLKHFEWQRTALRGCAPAICKIQKGLLCSRREKKIGEKGVAKTRPNRI